jgi:hypothetical protein
MGFNVQSQMIPMISYGADEGAMNKDFNYREIILRHQLIFLGGVPFHPEACSGVR